MKKLIALLMMATLCGCATFSPEPSRGLMTRHGAEHYARQAEKAGYTATVSGPRNWFNEGSKWQVNITEKSK